MDSHDNKNNKDTYKNTGTADGPKPPTIGNFVRAKGHEKVSDSDDTPNSDDTPKSYGDVNMEAEISADDVMRAGGFGARDDIGSFLPVASDSTDFEASLIDARDYEEPQRDVSRPGLGFSEGK